MFKKLKSKKGFTLVELLITIALFSIIGIGAVKLLIDTANIYNSTANRHSMQTATLISINEIRATVSASDNVEILGVIPTVYDSGYGYVYFQDNNIYKVIEKQRLEVGIDSMAINGPTTFVGKFSNKGKDVLGIDISLRHETSGAVIYQYNTNIRLHNLLEVEYPDPAPDPLPEGWDNQIFGVAEGACVKFKLPL